MSKPGFLNKENYKLENITKMTARIPIRQAHTMLILGVLLGGGLFLGAFLTNARCLGADIERIPEYIFMMIIGWMCFSFFFPLAYIVYLFKEIQLLKERNERIEKEIEGLQ